jgi:acyl-coenzyme A synthetase/AMP-(fatty) acid ligase/thioesterase domain-containing protein/acyl carrier protein
LWLATRPQPKKCCDHERVTTGPADLGIELQRTALAEPDRLALSDADQNLTYREMLAQAGELAASLPPADDVAPRPVAMLLPNSAGTVVAMIACLLAGRPYFVLSPAQPRWRLEALLATIDPEVIWVADPSRREKLETVGLPATAPIPVGEPADARGWQVRRSPSDADRICGIYATSGSSGSPKLVGYRHAAAHHRVGQYFAGLSPGPALDAGPDHRFALASSLWTAAGASGMFGALLSGASLHVFDLGATPPAVLADRVRASEATVWHSSPSAFRRLGRAGVLDGNRFLVVRLTGEPLLPSDVELARRICDSRTSLVIAYGLTETNGIVTQRAIPLGEAQAEDVLDSGRPLDGVEVRIENGDGGPLPAGVEGEIVIGGAFLAAGYLDAEEQPTKARFARRGEALVFHTGDRGLLHADGSLEIHGRADRRLNIRGHRVDPTEVEAAALQHGGVIDASVVPFNAGAQATALALFATRDPSDGSVTQSSLRAHLEQMLLPEALPALVSVLDDLPQTAAGKVDRMRLSRLAEDGDRLEPATRGRVDPLVTHLVQVWGEALETEQPGPDDDFFALGGDSLAASEVCAAVETVYGIQLEPATLLEHRSARAFTEHIRGILDGDPHVPARVLSLNPQGTRPPLFAVPGGGSDATALVHFAEAIGSEQPVHVIQLPGADGRRRPLARMDEIVGHCVAAIRQTDVRPPYRIAGTSFGGLVAYAVASELQSEGLEIEYLGLFDTPAPKTIPGHYLFRPLQQFLATPKLSARAFGLSPRKTLRRMKGPFRRLLTGYRRIFSVLLGRRPHRADLRFRYLRTGCSIAGDRWTPRPISIPVHLYRCESQPAHLAGAPLLGWGGLAPEVNVRPLRSGHGRHIRPPDVSQLAELVAEDLHT